MVAVCMASLIAIRLHGWIIRCLLVSLGEFDIVAVQPAEVCLLFFIGLANDTAGHAYDDVAVGDIQAGGYDSARSDKTTLANHGLAEHRGVHPDKGAVANRFAVNDGVVADGDVAADDIRHAGVAVDGGVVLDVGAVADSDGGNVPTDRRPVPDTRTLAKLDLTCDPRVVCEIGGFAVDRDGLE